MGSVRYRKEKNKGWEARWYGPDGRQHSKTFSTPTAANKYIKVKEGEREKGEYIDHRLNRTPFCDVAEAWFQNLRPETRHKTRVGYETILRTLKQEDLWGRPVGSITSGELEDLLNSLRLAPGTKRNVFRVVSAIMKRAVKFKMIPSNPCTDVALPKLDPAESHFLTVAQVHQLAEELGPPHDALILFAVHTGLRAGEISGLEVRHLDPLHGLVRVEQSVSDVNGHLIITKPKSRKSRRTVGVSREMIDQLIAGKGPDDYVFGGRDGQLRRHNNWMGRRFRPAVERLVKSGVWPRELEDLHFHDLRHTCASLLIHKGIHLKAVSEWLGHSSIALTGDRYGHLYEDHAGVVTTAMKELFDQADGTVAPLTSAN